MADTKSNLPIKGADKAPSTGASWHPFESIHREFDRLFADMDRMQWLSPFSRMAGVVPKAGNGETPWMSAPAVDVIEKNDAYEITADLPGMDEENIEVALVNGGLSIRGEKREEARDESADHYVRERRFGAFERSFSLPEGVNADKIEANYANGVLRVVLPKDPNAKAAKRRIDIRKH